MAKAGGCCQSHEISYFFQILGDANVFFFLSIFHISPFKFHLFPDGEWRTHLERVPRDRSGFCFLCCAFPYVHCLLLYSQRDDVG